MCDLCIFVLQPSTHYTLVNKPHFHTVSHVTLTHILTQKHPLTNVSLTNVAAVDGSISLWSSDSNTCVFRVTPPFAGDENCAKLRKSSIMEFEAERKMALEKAEEILAETKRAERENSISRIRGKSTTLPRPPSPLQSTSDDPFSRTHPNATAVDALVYLNAKKLLVSISSDSWCVIDKQ